MGYKILLAKMEDGTGGFKPNREEKPVEKMTELHYRLLQLLPKGADRLITITDLGKLLGQSNRTIYKLVQELIEDFNIPIVASRTGKQRGLFIPTNKAEVVLGIEPLKQSAIAMFLRAEKIEHIDLSRVDDRIKEVGDYFKEKANA